MRNTIKTVEIVPGAVEVAWADGHKSTYHHMWLRDNCVCDKCGAHASGSRLQPLLDIPDDITASSARAQGSTLAVTWANDRHESRFEAKWLRAHCYSNAERKRRHAKVIWDGSLRALPTVDYRLARDDEAERRKLFTAVVEYGFVLLKNVGTVHDEIERLANMIGYIRETHYGRVFDLKLRPNPQILADMPKGILPHTDETYRHVPTGINIFHCLQPSHDGGNSTLVDSLHLAARLREQDPGAFALLSRIPIQHERRVAGETIRSHHPVFTTSVDGDVTEVRLNERTMTALSLPPELMEPAYRALRKLFRLAYDPAHRIEHLLAAGEALVFDNLRVLHGRTGFTGERFLRQSQVMRDEFYARWTALTEKHLDSQRELS